MDNVTHALAGLVAAELAVAARARSAPVDAAWTRRAWLVSAVAQNLPDADVVYDGVVPGRLGYLLLHRGHTHTLVAAPLLGALAYLLGAAVARARGDERWSRADRGWMAALAVLGTVGHVAMDYANDYGVHPFWPLSGAWHYGDTLFIVEPLLFVVALPAIVAATRWWPGRVLGAALFALAIAAVWKVGMIPREGAVLTTAVAAVAALVTALLRERRAARAVAAAGAWAAVMAAFASSGASAERRARELVAAVRPHAVVLDVTRTPIPATPWCWRLVVVERDPSQGTYALRVVRAASGWPGVMSVDACEGRRPGAPVAGEDAVATAPLVATSIDGDGVRMTAELEVPLASFRSHAARCDVAAYLRWARAPFVANDASEAGKGGGGLVAGDLRYDRSPARDFDEVGLPREPPPPSGCPRFVPGWTPPRADLALPDATRAK